MIVQSWLGAVSLLVFRIFSTTFSALICIAKNVSSLHENVMNFIIYRTASIVTADLKKNLGGEYRRLETAW
jgi:hypothetical protein